MFAQGQFGGPARFRIAADWTGKTLAPQVETPTRKSYGCCLHTKRRVKGRGPKRRVAPAHVGSTREGCNALQSRAGATPPSPHHTAAAPSLSVLKTAAPHSPGRGDGGEGALPKRSKKTARGGKRRSNEATSLSAAQRAPPAPLLVNPGVGGRRPLGHALREPQHDLLVGAIDAVRSVDHVPSDLDAEVAADRAGGRGGRVGCARARAKENTPRRRTIRCCQ